MLKKLRKTPNNKVSKGITPEQRTEGAKREMELITKKYGVVLDVRQTIQIIPIEATQGPQQIPQEVKDKIEQEAPDKIEPIIPQEEK